MNLKLNKSRGILVDPEDEYLLHKHLFYISYYGYPVTKILGDTIRFLHKLILTVDSDIDHKSGNKLDNRRGNLREATTSQNLYNRGKAVTNTSGYKGVFKNRSLWMARIRVAGKILYLGSFTSKEQAALMYDMAAKKHHGEFANLNFNLELT